MTREERDPYDARTTRSTHRGDTESNDRPTAGRPASPDPLNPDWRSARGTRPLRRGQGLPSSRQEFVLWMQYGGWWATGDDTWVPWMVNYVYGTSYRTAPANIGKNMGWTDWMYGR